MMEAIKHLAEPQMVLGITGTRELLSPERGQALWDVLRDTPEDTVVHHGCCTGADASAHYAAVAHSLSVVCHPPSDRKCRAIFPDERDLKVEWRQPRDYLDRDADIVREANYLLAVPLHPEHDPRSKRSGTWATVRMARRKVIPIWLILPGGRLTMDRSPERTI